MRLMSCLVAFCLVSSSLRGQTSMVVASIGDVHTESAQRLIAGVTQSYTSRAVWGVLRGMNPDLILPLGDITDCGTRYETERAVAVYSLTSVSPGDVAVTIDTGSLNGSLYLFGVTPDTLPKAGSSNGMMLAIEEDDPAKFEFSRIVSIADSTHATIRFTKAHTAPFFMRMATLGEIRDYVYAGKVLVPPGNHDTLFSASDQDYSCGGGSNGLTAMIEAFGNTGTPPIGSNVMYTAGKGYGVYTLNALLTVIVIDNTSGIDGTTVGSTQELALRSALATCPSRWCIAIQHYPAYTKCTGNNGNTRWAGGTGVDLVLNGHCHAYERVLAPDAGGTRMIPYITNALFPYTSTMFISSSFTLGSCGTNCTVQAQSDYGLAGSHWSVAKMTITQNSLRWDLVSDDGSTILDTFTLSKSGGLYPLPSPRRH